MAYMDDFRQAGKLAKETLTYGTSLIRSGASYTEIIRNIYAKIHELGAEPAFPPQMALNETAAHFMPGPNEDIVLDDQLVKLDIGVSVNGAIGDTATTVDLSGRWNDLVQASRDALDTATDMIEVGMELREVGKAIQEAIASHDDYTSIKNLSGHGLAPYTIHCAPTIPNFDNGNTATFEPNMTFACEPFATNGKGLIRESGDGWIFRIQQKKPIRNPVARRILAQAETFNGLPFSLFELDTEKVPGFKLRVALKQLEQLDIIENYGPLVEEAGGMVSQAEHSILLDDEGNKFITTK